MKKTRILLLAMLMVFTLSGSASTAAEKVEYKEYESGDFSYTLDQGGNAEITGYRGDDRDLTVPSQVDGHPVTSIGEGAFLDRSGLTSVTLPEGLKSLGEYAFRGCSSLASVSLPDSLVSMSDNPFAGFSDLAAVHLSPDHPVFAVTDGVLFNHADKILVAYTRAGKPQDYTVPPGIKSIGNGAFRECTGLASVVLPEGLKSIGDNAFIACIYLASVTLPEGLQSIGDDAFCDCVNLASVTLPEGLESLGDNAFNWCRKFTSLVVPEGVKYIGHFAFGSCPRLISVTLPASLAAMGMDVFLDSYNTVLTVPRDSFALRYAQDNGIPYEVIAK